MKNDVYAESLKLHQQLGGKISIEAKLSVNNMAQLALAYTPGVAEPCKAIQRNPNSIYDLTWKGNTVAVVSDGTAVLGLGNIGPLAGMPVMEGKALLFKAFAGINAVPICMRCSCQENPDPEEIVTFVKQLSPSFGGINLEDLSAPHCVQVEQALQDIGIPVFHDDQHGTAIVVAAAMMNASKAVGKRLKDMTFVISGTGAAGSAIIKILHNLGVKEIYGFNKEQGLLNRKEASVKNYHFLDVQLAEITNSTCENLTLEEAMERADAFIGVSAPNIVTQKMVHSMKKNSIVFAMANPTPELTTTTQFWLAQQL